jgi:hypothetical protein
MKKTHFNQFTNLIFCLGLSIFIINLYRVIPFIGNEFLDKTQERFCLIIIYNLLFGVGIMMFGAIKKTI